MSGSAQHERLGNVRGPVHNGRMGILWGARMNRSDRRLLRKKNPDLLFDISMIEIRQTMLKARLVLTMEVDQWAKEEAQAIADECESLLAEGRSIKL